VPPLAHQSIVEILESLPTPHRNFLFDKFYGQLPETRLVDPRIQKLADIIGPRDIQYYTDLYLHKGGLLSWFVFREAKVLTQGGARVEVNAKRVELRILKKYPGIEEGLQPHLEWGGDPEPFYLSRQHGVLVLELAAMNAEREYTSNWKIKIIKYDRQYVIALRDDPFTIEIRSAYGKVDELYKVVSSVIGLRLDDGTECSLEEEKQRDTLKKKVTSRCFYAQHHHNDTEVAKTSVEAQRTYDLESGNRLKRIEAQRGVSGFSRSYEFQYKHPDGYMELCVYRVKLTNGQVRIEQDMSEPAVKVLQEHVVSLF